MSVRRRTGCVLACLVACGEPPELRVVIRDGPMHERADLSRMDLVLLRCEAEPQTVDLPTDDPPALDLALPPGGRFAVWVRGYAEPGAGSRAVSEACGPWMAFEPGLVLNLRLGPVEGFCPPPPDCP